MFKRNRKFLNPAVSLVNGTFCLIIIAFVSLGCGIVKNPFRDYKEKSFSSEEWMKGDAVERGRMFSDLFVSRKLDGMSHEDVLKLLGEPEKKTSLEGKEIWLYRVELAYQTPMKYFPVSFDGKKGAYAGQVKGGTISMLVEE